MKYNLLDLEKIFPNSSFDWLNNSFVKQVTERIGNYRFVGGCVRDSLIGKSTQDIDITTTLDPNEIEKRLEGFNISVIGKKFGTIGVFKDGLKIEITTTRKDINTYGRRADVAFTDSFYTDSLRRDFTVNALLFKWEYLEDFHGGIEDLKKGNIRFIGSAQKRIEEDFLRIIRYFRFVLRFGKITNIYDQPIIKNLEGLKKLSFERIFDELGKIIMHENCLEILNKMDKINIFKTVFNSPVFIDESIFIFSEMEDRLSIFLSKFNQKELLNLPISKNIRNLVNYFNTEDEPILKAAKLWKKYKEDKVAKKFLKFYGNIYKKNFDILIKTKWIHTPINFQLFDINDRSSEDIKSRIKYLTKLYIT